MLVEKMHKVRTISLDTDVIINVISYYRTDTSSLKPEDARLYQKAEESYKIARLMLADNVAIHPVGIKVIESEFSEKDPGLVMVYRRIFADIEKSSAEAYTLATLYQQRTSLKDADALILATCSVRKVDVFLSWNVHDFKDSTMKEVAKINETKGHFTPAVGTPFDFFDRLKLSRAVKTLSLALSNSPILPIEHLRLPK